MTRVKAATYRDGAGVPKDEQRALAASSMDTARLRAQGKSPLGVRSATRLRQGRRAQR